MDFASRYGPWAFVAGASMGIGAAFSHEAAARGLNVAMMARGEALLREEAERVRDQHGVDVRVLAGDLADPGIAKIVADATNDIEVGLLVYNATIAMAGQLPRRTDRGPARERASELRHDARARQPLRSRDARSRSWRDRARELHGRHRRLDQLQHVQRREGVPMGARRDAVGRARAFGRRRHVDPGRADVLAQLRRVPSDARPRAPRRPRLEGPARPSAGAALRPEHSAGRAPVALYDELPNGPVCYTHPDDEYIARSTLALPRAEAVALWHGVMDTSTRKPDRIAR